MKRLSVVALLGLTVLLSSGSAHAAPKPRGIGSALRALGGSIVIPPEWEGRWTTADSTYDCTAGFTSYSVDEDTICGGQVFSEEANGVQMNCSGTADATTMHATCTGSSEIFPDCQINFSTVIDVVRTGTTYRAVTTINITYTGTGVGCDFIPPSCTRIVTYGTRVDDPPVGFCEVTPIRRTTWGQLKTHYR